MTHDVPRKAMAVREPDERFAMRHFLAVGEAR